MDEFFLKDLTYCDVKVRSMDFIDISEDRIRLYYKTLKGEKGFDFYVVEFSSVICNAENRQEMDFDKPDVCVECLYHGIAYYDGIRHLYMGHKDTNNEGYLYYSDPESNIAIFEGLKTLCEKYCEL